MKKNLHLLCACAIAITTCTAQETTQPVANKSNRIILHFDDTTGIFTRLGRLFIERGYDIEMKDREFGLLRTKPRVYYSDINIKTKIKTIFRDSTVTLYADELFRDFYHDVRYTTRKGLFYTHTHEVWVEMMAMAEILKPKTITYSRFE
jgi:hypothetical protein